MPTVPASIVREIELIKIGVKRNKRVRKILDREALISRAMFNAGILSNIANTEPIMSFLKPGESMLIFRGDVGAIVLANPGDIRNQGCYILRETEYDRDPTDYTDINKDSFDFWEIEKIKRFGELTETQIWKLILKWLRAYRELLPDRR